MELVKDKESEETDVKVKPDSILNLEFIARIVGIRAPELGEGLNTIIEFELHTGEGYRGKFNVPYTPKVGHLGTAYRASIVLTEIPLEEYVQQRPETRSVQSKLDSSTPGIV